jgi:hypothetical protein
MKAITNFTIELERVKMQESLKPRSLPQTSHETPMLMAKIDNLNHIFNDLSERHQVGDNE